MKVWFIAGVIAAFLLLVVLAFINGGEKPKVVENLVPRQLPTASAGSGGTEGNPELKMSEEEKAERKRIATSRDAKISEGINLQRLAIQIVVSGSPGEAISAPRYETNFESIQGLEDDDLVIGLKGETQSRAYLVKQLAMPGQSVVNDIIDGRRFVLTWNNINRTALAFASQASGLNLSFRTAGKSWKSDFLFQDKETESTWSQVMGICVDGQLQGSTLDALPSIVTTWRSWKKSCPTTELAVLDETVESTEPFTGKFSLANPRVNSIAVAFANGKFEIVDQKQLIDERVVNFKIGENRVVVFYDAAADEAHGFRSLVGSQEYTFDWRGTIFVEHGTETVWDTNTGQATDGSMAHAKLSPIILIETATELWTATRLK